VVERARRLPQGSRLRSTERPAAVAETDCGITLNTLTSAFHVRVISTSWVYTAGPLFASSPERTARPEPLLTRLTLDPVQLFEACSASSLGTTRPAAWSVLPAGNNHPRRRWQSELAPPCRSREVLLVAFDHMGPALAFSPTVPDGGSKHTRRIARNPLLKRVHTEHCGAVDRDADPDDDVSRKWHARGQGGGAIARTQL